MTRRHDHTGASRLGRAWDAGSAKRAPNSKARALDVTCPTCDAAPNEQCINQGIRTGMADKGKPCGIHPTRSRLAQRKWNEAHL